MLHLLDTATFSANALTPQVLPPRIRKLLESDEVKALCGVSLLELAIHHRHGRLQLIGTLKEFFENALAQDIELLDITPEIAAATNHLPESFPGSFRQNNRGDCAHDESHLDYARQAYSRRRFLPC